MLEIKKIEWEEFLKLAKENHTIIPIEQSNIWAKYQNTIVDRCFFGHFSINKENKLVALLSLTEFSTHGYKYLRANHGPVYIDTPTKEEESQILKSIKSYFKKNYPRYLFIRLDTWYCGETTPVLSGIPYDETVYVDITGSDEEILGNMKARGRRDVRKALRECPAEIRDETNQAISDFGEYYNVMIDTSNRDKFSAAPMSDYQKMLQILGKDHARLTCARIDSNIASWEIYTIYDNFAIRYYSATNTKYKNMHVADRLLYSSLCMLKDSDVKTCDLMGIGSDFSPTLKGLNEFKTKFYRETKKVPASRDLPLNPGIYSLLKILRKIKKIFK